MGHGRKLTEDEERIIAIWRRTGVLVELDAKKLRARCSSGAILIACGDGDQSWDFISHLVLNIQCTTRIHLKNEDGGALRWNPNVPIPAELRIDEQLRRGLPVSRELKEIQTVLLSNHFPCGMGRKAGLDLPANLVALLQVADIFVQEMGWPAEHIVPLFHLDRDDRGKRAYFVEARTEEDVRRDI